MELTLLIQSAMGLLVVLGFLVFFLVSTSKAKKKVEVQKTKKIAQKQKQKTDIEFLKSIVKNRKSTTSELKEALNMVLKYHGTIHKKLGLRPHPKSQAYIDILFNVCRHPNADKDIIVDFDKELGKRNPEYKKELNDAMMRGLNSRGF